MKIVSLALLAASAVGLLGCANDPSGITDRTAPPGACGEIETHVVGVYAAPNGEATVTIDRPGRHVLVLSAYEATTWHVALSNGAQLVHVYATGYHAQTVDAPGVDVVTDSMDADQTYACGYSYPYDGQGCDTDQLFRLAALRIHHEATTFHGCKTASHWTIGTDLTTTSDCAVETTQNDWIGGCAAAADTPTEGCGGPLND